MGTTDLPYASASSGTTAALGSTKQAIRQVAAAVVGNLIEWYDWYAYSVLAVFFAPQYFPSSSDSSLVPLLAAFGVFAVGFLMRPLGSLFLGALGDRYGRKKALQATVALMGGGSLLIAVSPTYAQIGVLAPILLVLARMLQGLSTGGEFGAASAFLIESAPEGRRGLFSSFFYVGATAGNVAAVGSVALLSSLLDEGAMEAWGWRIPFLIGALAGLCAVWIRRSAVETLPEADLMDKGVVSRPSMWEFLRKHPVESLKIAGLVIAPAVCFYTWAVFLPTYAQITVGFDASQSLTVGLISLLYFWIAVPVCGWLSDIVGRKPMLYIFSIGFVVGTVPLLSSINNSFWRLLIVQCVGMTLLACWNSIASAVLCEMFPSRLRVLGTGFPYAITVAIFGGTAPYIATWLIDHDLTSMFGWYIVVTAVVSLAVFVTLPETAKKPLPK